jgi:hypothetical protein
VVQLLPTAGIDFAEDDVSVLPEAELDVVSVISKQSSFLSRQVLRSVRNSARVEHRQQETERRKSSVFNALLQKIVPSFEIPGTTRSVETTRFESGSVNGHREYAKQTIALSSSVLTDRWKR